MDNLPSHVICICSLCRDCDNDFGHRQPGKHLLRSIPKRLKLLLIATTFATLNSQRSSKARPTSHDSPHLTSTSVFLRPKNNMNIMLPRTLQQTTSPVFVLVSNGQW